MALQADLIFTTEHCLSSCGSPSWQRQPRIASSLPRSACASGWPLPLPWPMPLQRGMRLPVDPSVRNPILATSSGIFLFSNAMTKAAAPAFCSRNAVKSSVGSSSLEMPPGPPQPTWLPLEDRATPKRPRPIAAGNEATPFPPFFQWHHDSLCHQGNQTIKRCPANGIGRFLIARQYHKLRSGAFQLPQPANASRELFTRSPRS